jgi:MFS family permease
MLPEPLARVLAHRNYAWLLLGGAPSYVTTWMQRVGVGWLAWELTHSPLWLGLVAAADLAPALALSPFAGAITDRHDRLFQLRLSKFLLLLQALMLAAFQFAGLLSIELLFGLSLYSGLVHPFNQAARHSVVPSCVSRADFPTAIAVDSAIFQVSRFLGPAAAAVMIPWAGVAGAFLSHVAGLALFLFALFQLRLPPQARKDHAGRSVRADVAEGWRYVRGHDAIWPLLLMLAVASVMLRPIQEMLPGFAGQVFGADAVGLAWLTSSMGLGAFVSAVWIASRGRARGLTMVAVFGFLGLCLVTFGFVATRTLWIGAVCATVMGFTVNTMSTSIQTLVQLAVAEEMRGRVMSLYGLIWRGTPALGALVAGAAAEQIGLRATFAIAAALCLGAWAVAARHRKAIAQAAESAPLPLREKSAA